MKSDYQLFVAHIWDNGYKASGRPITGTDGRVIKGLLSSYDICKLKALWDIFMANNWNWYSGNVEVRVPHDLKNFKKKISEIIEFHLEWKSIESKYVSEIKIESPIENPSISLTKMPSKEDSQKNKVELIKMFEKIGSIGGNNV